MSWTPQAVLKRFYAEARAVALSASDGAGDAAADGGVDWTVELDGRPLRTPAKAVFAAPQAVAEAAAREWAAQGDRLDPASMPITRTVNSALDRVRPHRADVEREVTGYGGSDLLCYRAATPASLAARQAASWDPLLRWAEERFGARLVATSGVMHVLQPEAALTALGAEVAAESDLGLAALHEMTALTSSLVLALATARGRIEPQAAWSISRVDEEWQIEQWGRDAEAEEAADAKARAFHVAAEIATLSRAAAPARP